MSHRCEMASAVISVPTTASRFALLQVDSDSDSDSEPGKKSGKSGKGGTGKSASGKTSQNSDKKKEKKKRKKGQQQNEANEVSSVHYNGWPSSRHRYFIFTSLLKTRHLEVKQNLRIMKVVTSTQVLPHLFFSIVSEGYCSDFRRIMYAFRKVPSFTC